jgi:hypothetical protein
MHASMPSCIVLQKSSFVFTGSKASEKLHAAGRSMKSNLTD